MTGNITFNEINTQVNKTLCNLNCFTCFIPLSLVISSAAVVQKIYGTIIRFLAKDLNSKTTIRVFNNMIDLLPNIFLEDDMSNIIYYAPKEIITSTSFDKCPSTIILFKTNKTKVCNTYYFEGHKKPPSAQSTLSDLLLILRFPLIGFMGKTLEILGNSTLKDVSTPRSSKKLDLKPVNSFDASFKKIQNRKIGHNLAKLKSLNEPHGITEQFETVKFQVFAMDDAVDSYLLQLQKTFSNKNEFINYTATKLSKAKNFMEYNYLTTQKYVREMFKGCGEQVAITVFAGFNLIKNLIFTPHSWDNTKKKISQLATNSKTVKLGLYLYPFIYGATMWYYWYYKYQYINIDKYPLTNALLSPITPIIPNYFLTVFFTAVPASEFVLIAGIISGISDCIISIYNNNVKGHSTTVEFFFDHFMDNEKRSMHLKSHTKNILSFFIEDSKNLYSKNYNKLMNINQKLEKDTSNIGNIFYLSMSKKKYLVQDINKEIYLGLGDTFLTVFGKACNAISGNSSIKFFSLSQFVITHFRSFMVTTQAIFAKSLFYTAKELTLITLDISKLTLYNTYCLTRTALTTLYRGIDLGYSIIIDSFCDILDVIADHSVTFLERINDNIRETQEMHPL